MASLALVFDLLAKDNASPAFNKVGDAAGRAGEKGSLFGSAIGKGMAVAAGALTAAGLGTMFAGFVQDAAESAKIGRLTEAVIKSTGGAAKITAAQVSDLATSLSNKTAIDDEAIQSASNLLMTFTNVRNEAGKGNDIFNQTTEAALNMSTAMGTDANSAAMMLGKALNDPVAGMGKLSKAGVQFTAQQKEQVKAMVAAGDTLGAQKVILGEMETQFGGAAAAAADPIERLKVIAGNLGEEIGGALLPHVERFATFLSDTAMPALSNMAGVAKQAFDILFSGDFTGGPLAEDSGAVDKMFRIRDALVQVGGVARQAFDILFRGDFTGGPLAEDSGTVDILFRLRDAFVGLAGFLTGVVVPAFAAVGSIVLSTVGFFTQHQNAAIALGVVIAGVLAAVVAAWIAQGVVATQNAVISVAAWFTTATASTTSATIQSRSTAQIVVGWIAAAASAVANAAVVVAGWVAMGAQAMIQAVRMAAAWVIAMGPIGWVIAAVVGVVALIIANWDKIVSWTKSAWSAVSGAVSSAANAVVGFVVGLGARVVGTMLSAWNSVTSTVSGAWRSMVSAVSGGVSSVIGFVSGLPGRILGALGNMGSLLLNAGRSVIDGFLRGITGAFDKVKSTLGNLTSMLPDWKGPAERDEVILRDAGRLVMTGFENGLVSKFGDVKSTLGSLTGDLSAPVVGVGSGRYSAPAPAASSLVGLELTGRLEVMPDGMARIVDGRIVSVLTGATSRGEYNG